MAASIQWILLGTILYCSIWVVTHVQNGLCPYHSTIFTSKTRWMDPGCLMGTASPWPTPVPRGFGSHLPGQATTIPGTMQPWGSDCGSLALFDPPYRSKLDPHLVSQEKEGEGYLQTFYGMFSAVLNQIYKMLLHFLSCSGDRLLPTECFLGLKDNIIWNVYLLLLVAMELHW